MTVRIALFVATVALAFPAWSAQDEAEIEAEHNVVSEFVTPHTAWAKPYALGKTRALFFVRGHGTEPREVVELMQRFDLQAQMVFWARIVDTTNEGWHGGELGLRRIHRLLQEKWDVFVFLNIPLQRLPVEPQYNLLKAVTEGAGLVFVGQDDKRVLKPQNLLKPIPEFLAAGPVGEPFRVKQGRGIRLPARPSIPYRVGWEVEYDYWQERLGRAILWAAGKTPEVRVSVTATKAEVDRSLLPTEVAVVRVSDTRPARDLKLEIDLRRWDGHRIKAVTAPCERPETMIRMEVPVLRVGDYHVEVIAVSQRGVEAFATCPFRVTAPRRIAEVKLERDWGEVGERIAGSVALEGAPSGDERLHVSLFDRRGRELVRKGLDGTTEFSLPIEPWLPMLVRVQATLTKGGQVEGRAKDAPWREVASAYQFCRVTQRHRGQFNFLMWDMPAGTLAAYGEESLARTGVTLQLRGGTPPLEAAAFDIAWVPYTTRILSPKDDNGVMKPACWNDEAAIQAHVDKLVGAHEASREHGVFVYSLGDEGVTRGSCLSEHCLRAYRRYLKEVYGGIAALNKSWGTSFASFDQVTLSNPKDDGEADSLRQKNYPRWFDRQAFQSYNFAKLCERFGEAFHRLDPQSKCGFEGSGRFQDGDDIDLIVRANTFWSPYPGTADEVIRSVAPREFPRSNWMGYTKDADTLLAKYWRMVTRGCDAVWWWRWDGIGRFH
ncbi:MAG: hypothetical protein FJ279_18775, partial [Planctomycetes bacterium]|nr:hypothetical protein [Planctomycetota bacterium]